MPGTEGDTYGCAGPAAYCTAGVYEYCFAGPAGANAAGGVKDNGAAPGMGPPKPGMPPGMPASCSGAAYTTGWLAELGPGPGAAGVGAGAGAAGERIGAA